MKKTIKLAIVFVVAVMLCMLFAVFASAETYDVKLVWANTNQTWDSSNKTFKTNEDGTFTIPERQSTVTEGKEFYGWFGPDSTFYKPGDVVTFTSNVELFEANAWVINSQADASNLLTKKGNQLVKLNCDLTFTSQVSFDEWTTHRIDLNGHTITITSTSEYAMYIKRGGVKFYNSSDKEAKLIGTVKENGGRAFIHLEPHGYGDGRNHRLFVGKNIYIETNKSLIWTHHSYTGDTTIESPKLELYGKAKAENLIRTNGTSQSFVNAQISLFDGAEVELTGNTWWQTYNPTPKDTKLAIFKIGDVKFTVADPANFDWHVDLLVFKFDVTGGTYNVKIPDGILKYGYDDVYNAETGLYTVQYVPCDLEGSNGEHTFKVQEPFNDMSATCDLSGFHYYRCMCGSYYVDELGALGHSYTSVSIEKLATATESGIKRVTCENCNDSYTYEYSFDPRDQVVTVVVKTEDGTKEITISVGDLYNVEVSETDAGFTAKILSIKSFADPDNAEKTYTATDVVRAVIPAGITEIVADVFKNNSNLKEIILNDGANLTFATGFVENCPNLELIEVGDCTVVFNKNVIDGSYNNLTVDVSKANATFVGESFADDSGLKKLLMGSGKSYEFGAQCLRKVGLEEFIVPDYTASFKAAYATFYQTYNLKYAYIGRGITSLDNIFDQCDYLQKLVLMDVTEITGQYFVCLVNKGEDVLRIYHHADTLNVRQGNFLYQSYGVILYTNAMNFTTTPASIGSSNVTKTVNGVQVTYPAYTIVRGIPHEYKEGGVDATCTAMGSTGYTTDCPCGVVADATYTKYLAVSPNTEVNGTTAIAGEIVAGETTPALGHEFDTEKGATVVGTTPATCIKNATTTYKCARCDETMTVETPDSATGHTPDAEWTVTKNATCAADGLKQKSCTVCKALADSEIIPAFGHQASGEWVTIQEATCSVGATRVQYCKNENCEFVALKETTEPNGHTPSTEWTVTVPATCEKAGEKENRCTICRAIIEVVAIDAFGHEFDIADGAVVNAITYANGFDKNGVAFTKCARCDETSEGEVAPIFEAKGYSLNSDRTGLNGGYKINTEMLLAYETMNGSLNFGIVIANANSFGGAKLFNDENKVNSEKSIVAEAKERGFSSFDCSINGFGAHAGTLELVITMFVIDANGNVTYVQAVNDYANAVGTDKIADGIFTSVTLDLVRANIPEVASSNALLPSNDEE